MRSGEKSNGPTTPCTRMKVVSLSDYLDTGSRDGAEFRQLTDPVTDPKEYSATGETARSTPSSKAAAVTADQTYPPTDKGGD